MMSPSSDRTQSDARQDARTDARGARGYTRRIDCDGSRPRLEAASRPGRGPGVPADWSRTRGATR